MPQTDREYLRHALATVAYRTAKTLRDAPEAFADFRPGPQSKTALQILSHMADLYDWVLTMIKGEPRWRDSTPGSWTQERDRFYAALKRFDDYLASEQQANWPLSKLFQGAVADSLTHVGQLAMMRRLYGAPMKSESYSRAVIEIGRVGFEQTPPDPANEFD